MVWMHSHENATSVVKAKHKIACSIHIVIICNNIINMNILVPVKKAWETCWRIGLAKDCCSSRQSVGSLLWSSNHNQYFPALDVLRWPAIPVAVLIQFRSVELIAKEWQTEIYPCRNDSYITQCIMQLSAYKHTLWRHIMSVDTGLSFDILFLSTHARHILFVRDDTEILFESSPYYHLTWHFRNTTV